MGKVHAAVSVNIDTNALYYIYLLYFLISGIRFGNLSMKVALVYIISNFYIEPCEDTPLELKFDTRGFTLAARGGIYLKYTKIDNA